jgi:hypothetical protein
LAQILCAAYALVLAGDLFAAEAHTHGAAAMNVSVEGGAVTIAIETPLDNLLSFERAPIGEAEEEEVSAMASIMREADALFIFPPKADCAVQSVDLASEALGDRLFADGAESKSGATHEARGDHNKADDRGAHSDREAHADLDAEYAFICRNPKALNEIKVNLFRFFPRLNEIEAQIVTDAGQSAAELTADRNAIKIKR